MQDATGPTADVIKAAETDEDAMEKAEALEYFDKMRKGNERMHIIDFLAFAPMQMLLSEATTGYDPATLSTSTVSFTFQEFYSFMNNIGDTFGTLNEQGRIPIPFDEFFEIIKRAAATEDEVRLAKFDEDDKKVQATKLQEAIRSFIEEDFMIARDLVAEGKFAEAAQCYDRIVDLDPSSVAAFVGRYSSLISIESTLY